jgi:2-dehydropantoate 2-reductase
MDVLRIAVIGVGAVGGYFGGRLAQAGHDVVFLARGETLEALRTQGLRVKSIAGDFEIRHPNATADPTEIGLVDVILVAVKAPQVSQVARSLAPLVGLETSIIPLQNGLEAPDLLGQALGQEHVLGGLCKIFAAAAGPASVEHMGLQPSIEFGERNGSKSKRVERIRTAFQAASGMTTVTPDDIEAALWQKLLYVESLGAVGAVVREPAGVLRAVPETRRLVQSAMEEVVAIARKRGVALDPSLPEQGIRRLDELPAGASTSMQRDIAAGRPSEFEFQVGTVVRYGREAGVPIPVHSTIYAALLPSELRARGELPK